MEDRLHVAKQAITQAGKYILDQFHARHNVVMKADNTELLDEDTKSEDIIISTLHKSFPTDSFFTEERETEVTSDLVWVIDPICGSYSYLRGVETWSLSISLIRKPDTYELGLVYQPLLGNLFYAEKGKGAWRNDTQIHPAETKELKESFISVEHAVFNSGHVDMLKLISNIKRIRVGHGSGGEIAYVSAGYLDAVIKTNQTLVHFAGGRAILEIAGGLFVDFTGNRAPTYLDKTRNIHYIATTKKLLGSILLYCHS